ncbi:hypothetical protein HU200_033472 [Digitaria exilis]|uniref:Uncharacterized protein n=1 Tax=Digitaria exilis TaxID=1010633 RepID=A0A835BJ68_9POAL|nr:hypothetical protein HU200_033472 [Digitaria exilis]
MDAHLGPGSHFAAPPAARTEAAASPPTTTAVKQRAVEDQGASPGKVAGERKMGGDVAGAVAKQEGKGKKKKKKKGAPIVVHHFPFQSRLGLL